MLSHPLRRELFIIPNAKYFFYFLNIKPRYTLSNLKIVAIAVLGATNSIACTHIYRRWSRRPTRSCKMTPTVLWFRFMRRYNNMLWTLADCTHIMHQLPLNAIFTADVIGVLCTYTHTDTNIYCIMLSEIVLGAFMVDGTVAFRILLTEHAFYAH